MIKSPLAAQPNELQSFCPAPTALTTPCWKSIPAKAGILSAQVLAREALLLDPALPGWICAQPGWHAAASCQACWLASLSARFSACQIICIAPLGRTPHATHAAPPTAVLGGVWRKARLMHSAGGPNRITRRIYILMRTHQFNPVVIPFTENWIHRQPTSAASMWGGQVADRQQVAAMMAWPCLLLMQMNCHQSGNVGQWRAGLPRWSCDLQI